MLFMVALHVAGGAFVAPVHLQFDVDRMQVRALQHKAGHARQFDDSILDASGRQPGAPGEESIWRHRLGHHRPARSAHRCTWNTCLDGLRVPLGSASGFTLRGEACWTSRCAGRAVLRAGPGISAPHEPAAACDRSLAGLAATRSRNSRPVTPFELTLDAAPIRLRPLRVQTRRDALCRAHAGRRGAGAAWGLAQNQALARSRPQWMALHTLPAQAGVASPP